MQTDNPTILFCDCSYADILPTETRKKILATPGLNMRVVPDLCELAANKAPLLNDIAARNSIIIACYPRAVRWLFHSAGLELNNNCRVLNMRTQSAEEIINELPVVESGQQSISAPEAGHSPDWPPWFPVIDYSRCCNCKQCSSFCLFGVYQVSRENNVEVVNPRNCKNNCPACARICPEAAIMFPKLDESPINGAEIEDEELVRANVKVNVKKILGSDTYKALAERRKKAKMRLLKKDPNAVEQAYKEREHWRENHPPRPTGTPPEEGTSPKQRIP